MTPLIRSGTMPVTVAAQMFHLSGRQLRRYVGGLPRHARTPWNRLSDDIRQYVIATKEEFPDHNCQWISELTSDHIGATVSQSSVWRILKSADLLDRASSPPTVRQRFEAKQSGDLVQMDTTWGYWLKGERLCLILLLDDYSRYIVAAEFFWEDSAWNNMSMIRDVVEDYGTFRMLYTDNASFFKVIRHNRSIYQTHRQSEYESGITRACREIGITHITHKPFQPQGKGKIERLFRFIQERVVSQFERNKVVDLEGANMALWEWVDWYHKQHVNRTTRCVPKKRFDPTGFIPLSGEVNLDDVFCWQDSRKVDKCNQFSYEGTTYTIPPEHRLVHARVNLNVQPHRSIRVWYGGQFVVELPIPVDES